MTSSNFEKDWRESSVTPEQQAMFNRLLFSAMLLGIGIWIGNLLFAYDQGYNINIYTELLSIITTVGILNFLAQKREERRDREQLKSLLVRQMGSRINEVAVPAVEELRAQGWLQDGSLVGADLWEADLTNAVLWRANLTKAQLHRAKLQNTNLTDANLQDAELNGADIQHSLLLRTNLDGAKLEDVDLSGSDLQGIRLIGMDLRTVRLAHTELSHANLEGADLSRHMNLEFPTRNQDLVRMNLFQANLRNAILSGINWEGIILYRANLEGADLFSTYLSGANLSSANLRGANLAYANLHDADLSFADMQGVQNLEQASFNSNTILPDGNTWNSGIDLHVYTDPENPKFWRSDNLNSPAYKDMEESC